MNTTPTNRNSVVYCCATPPEHRGMHYESPDCAWPHDVAPSGPCPIVQDETGNLTGEYTEVTA